MREARVQEKAAWRASWLTLQRWQLAQELKGFTGGYVVDWVCDKSCDQISLSGKELVTLLPLKGLTAFQ